MDLFCTCPVPVPAKEAACCSSCGGFVRTPAVRAWLRRGLRAELILKLALLVLGLAGLLNPLLAGCLTVIPIPYVRDLLGLLMLGMGDPTAVIHRSHLLSSVGVCLFAAGVIVATSPLPRPKLATADEAVRVAARACACVLLVFSLTERMFPQLSRYLVQACPTLLVVARSSSLFLPYDVSRLLLPVLILASVAIARLHLREFVADGKTARRLSLALGAWAVLEALDALRFRLSIPFGQVLAITSFLGGWIAGLLAVGYGWRYLSLWRTTLKRWLRSPSGFCPKCGYDLRGNTSGVCPECGTPVPVTSVASVPSCSNQQEKTEETDRT